MDKVEKIRIAGYLLAMTTYMDDIRRDYMLEEEGIRMSDEDYVAFEKMSKNIEKELSEFVTKFVG